MKKKRRNLSDNSKKRYINETEYLMFSETNKKTLDESIQQIDNGKGVKLILTDLWK